MVDIYVGGYCFDVCCFMQIEDGEVNVFMGV